MPNSEKKSFIDTTDLVRIYFNQIMVDFAFNSMWKAYQFWKTFFCSGLVFWDEPCFDINIVAGQVILSIVPEAYNDLSNGYKGSNKYQFPKLPQRNESHYLVHPSEQPSSPILPSSLKVELYNHQKKISVSLKKTPESDSEKRLILQDKKNFLKACKNIGSVGAFKQIKLGNPHYNRCYFWSKTASLASEVETHLNKVKELRSDIDKHLIVLTRKLLFVKRAQAWEAKVKVLDAARTALETHNYVELDKLMSKDDLYREGCFSKTVKLLNRIDDLELRSVAAPAVQISC